MANILSGRRPQGGGQSYLARGHLCERDTSGGIRVRGSRRERADRGRREAIGATVPRRARRGSFRACAGRSGTSRHKLPFPCDGPSRALLPFVELERERVRGRRVSLPLGETGARHDQGSLEEDRVRESRAPIQDTAENDARDLGVAAAGSPAPPPHAYKVLTVRQYAREHATPVFVETGTYMGDMVFAVKDVFAAIYTIELDPNLHLRCQSPFRGRQTGSCSDG